MRTVKRWRMVVLFATAMAWLESAIVLYGRLLVGRLEPYQPNPLPFMAELGPTELVREAATMVMLWAVGWFAGDTRRARWAFACLAFGVWDVFYYIFLRIICGWPRTLFDWDVLFLIPLPWWGPVIAPMLIATLMIAWGTLVALNDTADRPLRSHWPVWATAAAGAALALAVFMADAMRVANGGIEALCNVLPVKFNWPLFGVALALLAAPAVDVTRQLWRRAIELTEEELCA
ncbi:MAG: hypothetical protein NT105_22145 [Verrucomicrobia bacterium]|nr:hypothetical protein [Verrucomicrobiota bacterium]